MSRRRKLSKRERRAQRIARAEVWAAYVASGGRRRRLPWTARQRWTVTAAAFVVAIAGAFLWILSH